MPVLDAVQTFAGISNDNEFFSHHYMAEVFRGDIKTRIDAWEADEAANAGDEAHRAPPKRLQNWAQKWFALRGQINRAKVFAKAEFKTSVIDENHNLSSTDTVYFSTMHRAKGLEFDQVIVIGPSDYLGDPLETDSKRKLNTISKVELAVE